MKRFIIATLIALCSSFIANAQQDFTPLLQQLKSHRVSLDYQYTIPGVPDITVKGKAVVQQNCFRMEGPGIMILCNGDVIWTLDLEGKEAYIEKAGPMDYMDYVSDLAYEDGMIVGNYSEPLSGTLMPFVITNVVMNPLSGEMEIFSPDESLLKGDWIITDLR